MTQNNSQFGQFDLVDLTFDESQDTLQKRVKRNTYTASKEIVNETSMSGALEEPFETLNPVPSQKKSTYQPKKKLRVLSPPRHDSFQAGEAEPETGMRTYSEILLARKLENQQVDLEAKVSKVLKEQAKASKIAMASAKQEKTIPKVIMASTAESSASDWEKDEPLSKAEKAKMSKWDRAEVTPTSTRISSRGFGFAETPTPRKLGKSRWDETPNMAGQHGQQTPNRLIGGETPSMLVKGGWETPTAGQFRGMEALTPGRVQQLVMERQVDERNKPWTEEEIDQLLPSAGFEH